MFSPDSDGAVYPPPPPLTDSAPSEARKRMSGGSPRKYDDLLTGPFGPSDSLLDNVLDTEVGQVR
jgi:hypothetical protein